MPIRCRTCRRTPKLPPVDGGAAVPPHRRDGGFSLIEIMLVVVLLSLIMLALMAVFSATQTAFRASVTQTDILQGGRATMDLLTADFRQMVPSGGSNAAPMASRGAQEPSLATHPPQLPPSSVNFWLSPAVSTIQQALIATAPPQTRTNQVETFFILSCENQVWKGVGYFVDTYSTNYIYPLYRYDSTWFTLTNRYGPMPIFDNFLTNLPTANAPALDSNPNIHHILDGVLHLNVRAFDTNGVMLTNGYSSGQAMPVTNHATFYQMSPGSTEVSMLLWSNTLPAAVEIQMGVLEDRSLSRAASFVTSGEVYNGSNVGFSNYVSQLAGKVHVFRQRVTIPNCDPTAYQ